MSVQLYDVRLVAQNEKAPVTDYSYTNFANDDDGPNYKSVNGAYFKEDADLLCDKFEGSPLSRDYKPTAVEHDMSTLGEYQAQLVGDKWHNQVDSVFKNTVDRIMMRYPEEDRPGTTKERPVPTMDNLNPNPAPQFDGVFYCDM